MILSIKHTTSYSYEEGLTHAQQQIRLKPSSNLLQKVLNWDVDVEGGQIELIYPDQFDNQTMLIQAKCGQNKIRITAHGKVETIDKIGVLDGKNELIPPGYFVKKTPRTLAGAGIKSIAGKVGRRQTLLKNCIHYLILFLKRCHIVQLSLLQRLLPKRLLKPVLVFAKIMPKFLFRC